jgi:hypothetical protein
MNDKHSGRYSHHCALNSPALYITTPRTSTLISKLDNPPSWLELQTTYSTRCPRVSWFCIVSQTIPCLQVNIITIFLTSHLSHACHMSCPSHCPRCSHPNHVYCRIQIANNQAACRRHLFFFLVKREHCQVVNSLNSTQTKRTRFVDRVLQTTSVYINTLKGKCRARTGLKARGISELSARWSSGNYNTEEVTVGIM